MKKITLDTLLQASGETEYQKQYEYIAALLRSGKLIPVKRAPLNGRRPALCTAYWENTEEPADKEKLKEELLFRISPKINTGYYLNHLANYQREREQVLKLNHFLMEEQEALKDTVSLNERSFQIWGREKFLQREQGNKLLSHCGLKAEDLNIYRTIEPLAYYSADHSIPQRILILENKDTFYTMRRFLMEGGRFIFSEEIRSVIYGAGKGVLRSFEDFFFCMEEYMRHPQNRILYFGDLDYEGIRIYEQLGRIDANSTIHLREKPVKMLRIILPVWEENEALYRQRVGDHIDDVLGNCVALLEENKPIQEFIGSRITTRVLYNAVVGSANVQIKLNKIEKEREYPISWADVSRNSGGEGFLSAFVVLSALMYYARREETDLFSEKNESKVLIMDNPFATTNASHLLIPMMEVAKKSNVQLICLTGMGGNSIYDRFNNIYTMELVSSNLRGGMQYLKSRHVRGSDEKTMLTARVEVLEQLSFYVEDE